MVVAMQSSATALQFEEAARLGGLCGLGVVVATYVANAFIRPQATRWTT